MFELVEAVIKRGGYKYDEVQRKVLKLYVEGALSEDEANELLLLAAKGANAASERPEVLEMLRALSARMDAFDVRVKALEAGSAGGGEGEDPSTGEGTDTIEAWAPWDGISDKYQPGAVVTHTGYVWESTFDGQNVWEPGVVGEQFWKKGDAVA